MYTRIKTDQEIKDMRASGKILAKIHKLLGASLEAGMSTEDLANIASDELKRLGGEPAFLGYGTPIPFPNVICVSINEEVVHGIPRSDKIIHDGDLVSLDLGVAINGMITDAAVTLICGSSTEKTQRFVDDTKKALNAGLKVIKHGCQVGDISF